MENSQTMRKRGLSGAAVQRGPSQQAAPLISLINRTKSTKQMGPQRNWGSCATPTGTNACMSCSSAPTRCNSKINTHTRKHSHTRMSLSKKTCKNPHRGRCTSSQVESLTRPRTLPQQNAHADKQPPTPQPFQTHPL